MKAQAEKVTLALFDYCRKNNWAGYDPYDALNSRIFKFLPFLDYRWPRIALTQMLKRSPVNFRSLLLVDKIQNPKAMALFLMAIIKLTRLGLIDEQGLLGKMVERLEVLKAKESPYWCWGYSFPWQTRTILVPRWAPNLVCTTFVANALLDAYEMTGEKRCLNMALSAAEYILNDLYWEEDDFVACFAYPLPSSRSRVHNANFLGAAILARVSKHSGETKFLDPALKVARYSATKQREDGSWDYGELGTQKWIDNFHTGYNVCALQSIGQSTGSSEFESHIRHGFEFYTNHFFTRSGEAKYFHNRTYPIDIHSIAQSIITLLDLKDYNDNSTNLALTVFQWAMKNMWDERGYFYYRAYPGFRIKTSYMRWSQAWMLYALAVFLDHESTKWGKRKIILDL